MRTTFITLGLLILILGGVGIYVLISGDSSIHLPFIGSRSSEQIPNTYAENIVISQNQEIAQTEIYNAAIEKQDIHLCDTIEGVRKGECQDTILASSAQASDDIEKCSSLTSSGFVTQCQDNIYVARAQKSLKKKDCDNITSTHLKGYCQTQVDTKLLQMAVEKNTVSETFCSSLVSELQAQCGESVIRVDDPTIYAEALEKKDMEICEKITDTVLKNTCHDAIVLQIALGEKQPDFCDSIYDETKRKYCQDTLILKTDAEKFQDIVATGDIAGCNSLSSKPLRYQCSDVITLNQVRREHDATLCENLFDTKKQFACVQIANKNN